MLLFFFFRAKKDQPVVELEFSEEGEFLNVNELTEYLTLLKGVYNFLGKNKKLFKQYEDLDGIEEDELNEFKNLVEISLIKEGITQQRVQRSFKVDPEEPLEIVRLKKESPLIIAFSATVILLTAAIILSGGELEYSDGEKNKFKFKVGKLSEGLNGMRDFLDRSARSKKINEKIDSIFSEDSEKELKAGLKQLNKVLKVEGLDKKTKRAIKEAIKEIRDRLK